MRLSCQTLGNPSHPAILLLHGFLGQAGDWLETVRSLSEEYLCILPDLPGHGKSADLSILSSLDMHSTVEALIALLDDLKVETVTLLGYSMGGRIALQTAVSFPMRVRALILESASPGIENDAERMARAALDDQRAESIARGGLADFVEQWYDAPLFRSLHQQPERLALLKQSRVHQNPQSLAAAMRGLSVGRQQSLWHKLNEVQIPTLLLSGSLDTQYCSVTDRMAPQMPHSRRVVIDDAGHNTHFEKPEDFLARLRQFLHDYL
jgi:2-succinyl-6-hydroxy-2,4-cyclohexadiene-1-carboxylate synthase